MSRVVVPRAMNMKEYVCHVMLCVRHALEEAHRTVPLASKVGLKAFPFPSPSPCRLELKRKNMIY